MNGWGFATLVGLVVLSAGRLNAQASDPPTKLDSSTHPSVVHSLAFSPEGKILVATVSSKDQPSVVMGWDIESKKLLWQQRGTTWFSSVSFAPDGKSIAVTNDTFAALRLDSATGKELGTVGPHAAKVRAVVHIPGTNLLATGSDGVIRLWDLKSGKVEKELKGHPAEVHSLVVSPNGRWLVSTGLDATRLWNVTTSAEMKDIIDQKLGDRYQSAVFVDSNRVLVSRGDTHKLVDFPSGKEVMRYSNLHGDDVCAHSAVAGLAAYHQFDTNEFRIADLTFRSPTPAEKDQIEKLLKSFDSDSYDVREAASKAMQKLGSVAEPMLRAAMVDDSSLEVRIRASEARKAILDAVIHRVRGHSGVVGPMVFSPDGKILATGAKDGTIRLWDPLTGKQLVRLDVATSIEKAQP